MFHNKNKIYYIVIISSKSPNTDDYFILCLLFYAILIIPLAIETYHFKMPENQWWFFYFLLYSGTYRDLVFDCKRIFINKHALKHDLNKHFIKTNQNIGNLCSRIEYKSACHSFLRDAISFCTISSDLTPNQTEWYF